MPLPSNYFAEGPDIMFAKIQDIDISTEGDWGPRIVVRLLPIGETVERLVFFNAESASGRRSGWQRFLRNFRTVGLEVTDANDLIGDQVYKFQIITESYEIRGEVRESDKWICKQVYENEEAAMEDFLEHQANIGPGVPLAASEPESKKPAKSGDGGFSKELIEKALPMFKAAGGDDNFLQIAMLSYGADGIANEEDAKKLLEAIKAAE